MKVTKELSLGGKTFSFETGRFAKQADGAVMVRYGDTMVLAAVVSARHVKEGQDFFPLQVEYREKTAAAGKNPVLPSRKMTAMCWVDAPPLPP